MCQLTIHLKSGRVVRTFWCLRLIDEARTIGELAVANGKAKSWTVVVTP
jgi:hypothetical protein